MSRQTGKRIIKIAIRVIALVLVLLIGGVVFDLYYPRTTKMREFDITRLKPAEFPRKIGPGSTNC